MGLAALLLAERARQESTSIWQEALPMLCSPNGSLCPLVSICKWHQVRHLQGWFFYCVCEKGLPLAPRRRAVALPGGAQAPAAASRPLPLSSATHGHPSAWQGFSWPTPVPRCTGAARAAAAAPTHQVRHQHQGESCRFFFQHPLKNPIFPGKIQFGALASGWFVSASAFAT